MMHSQFSGMIVRDDETGEPKVFSERAAEQLVHVVTEPKAEKVSTDTGGFYVILK